MNHLFMVEMKNMIKDLRKEIVEKLEGIDKYRCLDCIGFCNFGEYPNCKSSVKKNAERMIKD